MHRLPRSSQLWQLSRSCRTHQLRLHLMALGHPIVGDPLYASEPWPSLSPRLLLHACSLRFDHPVTGVALALSHPAPF